MSDPSSISVLVVDDNPVDRRYAGRLVEKHTAGKVHYAENGADALAKIAELKPDVVLTDLQMPEMDGLELVQEIRQKFPGVAVILMTGQGSEQIAIQALRAGAASYVAKQTMTRDIGPTLEMVRAVARVDETRQRLMACLVRRESEFTIDNDPALIPQLVAMLQEDLSAMKLADESVRMRVGIALEEALLNALYHGNLEVSSALRQDDDQAYQRLAAERRQLGPYKDRRLHLHVRLTPDEASYVIRDEGPGFDPSKLPDPTDPENMLLASGRGLLLIRTFMDEVRFNATGNEITLVKRRTA